MLRYIIFLFISLIILLNTITINKLLEFSLSKWFGKKIEIENLDILYLKQRLNLENIKIKDENQNKGYNLLEIKKVVIEIKLNSIFSEEIIFPLLIIEKAKFIYELEFNETGYKDNLGLIQKELNNEPDKVYKPKKKDKNFLINEVKLINPTAIVIIPNIDKGINIEYSNMYFSNIGNGKSKNQHYKDLFQYLLKDLYLRIPVKNKVNDINKLFKKLLNK